MLPTSTNSFKTQYFFYLFWFQQGYTDIANFEIGILFHSGPEKEYRALNPACPVHSCDTVKRSTYDKSTCGDVGSVNGEEEIVLERAKSEKREEKEEEVEEEEEEELERETGTKDDNRCESKNKMKNKDNNIYNVTDSSYTMSKIKDNIVILPYPFNVLGGVPYYLEDEARYSHKPFVSGCAKEVRKLVGSCIPIQILILLPLYCYFSIFRYFLILFFLFFFHLFRSFS